MANGTVSSIDPSVSNARWASRSCRATKYKGQSDCWQAHGCHPVTRGSNDKYLWSASSPCMSFRDNVACEWSYLSALMTNHFPNLLGWTTFLPLYQMTGFFPCGAKMANRRNYGQTSMRTCVLAYAFEKCPRVCMVQSVLYPKRRRSSCPY